jgi:hypothetical protein
MQQVRISDKYMKLFDADPGREIPIVPENAFNMPAPDTDVEIIFKGAVVGTARVLRWFIYGGRYNYKDGRYLRRKGASVNAFIITEFKSAE